MLEKLRAAMNRRRVRVTWQKFTKTDQVNVDESERFLSIIGGVGLVLYGLVRRSAPDLGFGLAGGYLLYRGLTGHCPVYQGLGFSTASRTERLQFKAGDKPNYQLNQQDFNEGELESAGQVDEAVGESFPASDPPAWTSSRIGQSPVK